MADVLPEAAFETEFVLPPRSPKLNGCVERAQRTHMEEFYEVIEFSLEVAALNLELLAWEHTCNTVRPHQAWVTSPRTNSPVSGNINEKRQSATNHLDEYRSTTC